MGYRMSLNVVYLETGIGEGGALYSLKDLVYGLGKHGINAYVITSYAQNMIYNRENVKQVICWPRLRLYSDKSRIGKGMRLIGGKYGNALAFLFDHFTSGRSYSGNIVNLLKVCNADILHLNNGILCNDVGILAGRKAKVLTIAHCRAEEHSGWASKMLSRWVNGFIAVSEFVKGGLIKLVGPDAKVKCIYEGVDWDLFCNKADASEFRRGFNIDESYLLIGMVGFFLPWKGQDVFLYAFSRIAKKFPNALAVLVGDSPDGQADYKNELRKMSEELGISNRVLFTGKLNKVAAAMSACSVVVHASTEPEPFGRVVIEAMGMGKPVIATKGGGPSEIIEDGKNGFLVPAGDYVKLADRIENLLKDMEMGRRFGEYGRKVVQERFTLDKYAEDVANFYLEMMADKNSRQMWNEINWSQNKV